MERPASTRAELPLSTQLGHSLTPCWMAASGQEYAFARPPL